MQDLPETWFLKPAAVTGTVPHSVLL